MAELLIDSIPFVRVQLSEDASKPGKIIVRGQFARSDKATENKRLYRERLWRREFGRLSESIGNRRMFGELDHPADGRTKLSRVSHIITKLDVSGNEVIGEAEVLDTPNGRIMKALAEAQAQVGVSSRGFGSTKVMPDGTLEVQEDFRLDTFDFVADPATKTAYPKVFAEERERMFEGDAMTLDDLRRNYPGLVEELSRQLTEQGAGMNLSRLIQETEERTTKRLTDDFGVKLRRATEVLEDEITETVRSEMLSDPGVAGARQVVEQIVGLVKSYGLDPQAREDLDKQAAQLDLLKGKLADRELEAVKLKTESDELRKLAKQAAYMLHLERLVGGDPSREAIEALIGDVSSFERKEDIDSKVTAIKAELDKRGGTVEKKDGPTKIIARKDEEIETLTKRIKALEADKSKATERAVTAEGNSRKALRVAEDLEVQLAVERSIVDTDSEHRLALRELCEGADSIEDVEKIVKRFKPERRIDEDEASRIRARVTRGKTRDLNEDTHGSREKGSNGRGDGPLAEIGLRTDDFDRLVGKKQQHRA
jgi:archaellum component FlaC